MRFSASSLFAAFLLLGASSKAAFAAPSGQAQQDQDKRQGYQKKVQADLDELSAKIGTLEAKSAKSGSKTRKEIKAEIRRLKSDLAASKKKLKKLEKSSASAWDTLKADVEKGVDGLRDSYQKVSDKLND